jgi:hypothetical protein
MVLMVLAGKLVVSRADLEHGSVFLHAEEVYAGGVEDISAVLGVATQFVGRQKKSRG